MTRRCFFHVTMNTNQSLNSRGSHIVWVDFLRILACFLVVLAHCCDPFVGSFDGSFNFKSAVFWGSLVRPCVPLFAMISGVLLFPVTLEMGAFYSRRLLSPAQKRQARGYCRGHHPAVWRHHCQSGAAHRYPRRGRRTRDRVHR